MTNKQLRIAITISQEEYNKIKELSGIASMSAYLRSKVFGSTVESLSKADNMDGWIYILSKLQDRDKMLKYLIWYSNKVNNTPEEFFVKKMFPQGYNIN